MKTKNIFLLTLLLILGVIPVSGQNKTSLFNGKDFNGWLVPENNIWWTIHEGTIKVKSDPQKRESVLWTNTSYENFILELEFKFGDGTVDSGIFLRDITQQIQLGISSSLKRDMTCSPYIEGLGYPIEASGVADLLELNDWNHIVIKVIDNHYTVWLNEKKVMTYSSTNPPKKGPIGLQLHQSHEMEISFRSLFISEIIH